MHAAITSTGEIIYANNLTQGNIDEIVYCPTCQQALIYKVSSNGKGFFSHLTSCQKDFQPRMTQESQTHLSAKILLKDNLQASGYSAHIEYPIEDAQQIADLYVINPNSVTPYQIIEFQKVPIRAELIRVRTQAYLEIVDKCTWFIDEEIFNTGYRQTWLQTMVTYSSRLGFHWQVLNVDKQEWVIKFKMPVMFQPHRVQLCEKRFNLETPLDSVWESPSDHLKKGVHYSFYRRPQGQSTYFKQLKQIMTQATYQKAIRALYSEGILLQTLPQWMVIEKWQFLVCKSPGWQCLAWAYYLVEQFGLESFTTTELENGFKRLIEEGRFKLAVMPLVSADLVSLFVDSLLDKFIEKEIIFADGYQRWKGNSKDID